MKAWRQYWPVMFIQVCDPLTAIATEKGRDGPWRTGLFRTKELGCEQEKNKRLLGSGHCTKQVHGAHSS